MLSGFAITAVLVNLVPILSEKGFSKTSAALVTSMLGIAVILGRVVVGFLLDKLFAPYITAAILLAPAMAFLLLSTGSNLYIVYFSAALIGLAVGAEVDIMAYLVSRYFKPHQFGFLNGLMFSFFVASGAFGPICLAYLRELQGNYEIALQLMSAIIVAAAICVLFSPKYKVH